MSRSTVFIIFVLVAVLLMTAMVPGMRVDGVKARVPAGTICSDLPCGDIAIHKADGGHTVQQAYIYSTQGYGSKKYVGRSEIKVSILFDKGQEITLKGGHALKNNCLIGDLVTKNICNFQLVFDPESDAIGISN